MGWMHRGVEGRKSGEEKGGEERAQNVRLTPKRSLWFTPPGQFVSIELLQQQNESCVCGCVFVGAHF